MYKNLLIRDIYRLDKRTKYGYIYLIEYIQNIDTFICHRIYKI